MATTAGGTSACVPVSATRRASAVQRHVLSILDLSPGDVLGLCRRAIAIRLAVQSSWVDPAAVAATKPMLPRRAGAG